MSARSDARAAMATPALLLFVITCLAQLIAGMRGGGGTTTVLVRGGGTVENNDGDGGSDIVDGDDGAGGGNIDATGGSSDASDEGDGGSISLERHHHGHDGHRGGGNRYNPSRTETEVKDDGHFDFYVYSMSYQPEFCRENKERFAGCHSFREDWEGQLTIHGLWPNVSYVPRSCPNIACLIPNSPSHISLFSHTLSHQTNKPSKIEVRRNVAVAMHIGTPRYRPPIRAIGRYGQKVAQRQGSRRWIEGTRIVLVSRVEQARHLFGIGAAGE